MNLSRELAFPQTQPLGEILDEQILKSNSQTCISTFENLFAFQ